MRNRVSHVVGYSCPVISSMAMASQRPASSSISDPRVTCSLAHSMADLVVALMLLARILVHSAMQILPLSVTERVPSLQLQISLASLLASLPAAALSFPVAQSSCELCRRKQRPRKRQWAPSGPSSPGCAKSWVPSMRQYWWQFRSRSSPDEHVHWFPAHLVHQSRWLQLCNGRWLLQMG